MSPNCWPTFLYVVLEHRDAGEIIERTLSADSPENEARKFLAVFFEAFGQFIAQKYARRGAQPSNLKEAIQLFGEKLFFQFMRTYRG